MNIAIADCCHSCEGPIKTENVLRIDIRLINTSNYKPTVWVGKFALSNDKKEASDPMCDKGDHND